MNINTSKDQIYKWKSIILSLNNFKTLEKLTQENQASIDKIHSKILKDPEGWNIKSAKKCRKLYNQAMERFSEENKLILEIVDNIDSIIKQMEADLTQEAKKTRKLSRPIGEIFDDNDDGVMEENERKKLKH